MHTPLDLRRKFRSFVHIPDGNLHHVNGRDLLRSEHGAVYIMDRAYVDFEWRPLLHLAGSFFVTRATSNRNARRIYATPANDATSVILDKAIAHNGFKSARNQPSHLRHIRVHDPESGKALIFVTNNLTLPATAVCALYKARWHMQLFSNG